MVLTIILISCRNRFLVVRLLGSQDRELCRNLTVLSTILQLVNVKNEASVGSMGCELVRALKMRTKASNLLRHPSVDGTVAVGLRIAYLGCCPPV